MSSVQLRPAPNSDPEPTVSVGRLFEEYSDRIYAFCLHRLGSASDAEDAVQTTFLCAHRAVQRGVLPESESAWLFAIAKNVCRWQQRTTFRRNRLLTDAELETLASPSTGDDDGLLVGLKEALASIPESQRRALVLREWRGLSSSEVAGQLGMSQPATYALLTRARHSLAHALTALPQQAALGVVALVYEVRSHIKALFGGGVAVKTVAATSIVAAVAVGGVAVERAVGGDRGAPSVRSPVTIPAKLAGSPVQSRLRSRPVPTSASRTAETLGIPGSSTSAVTGRSSANTTGAVAGESPAPTSSPDAAADPKAQADVVSDKVSDLTKLPDIPEPLSLPELSPVPALPPLPTDLLPEVPEPPPLPAPELPPLDLAPAPVEPPAVPLPTDPPPLPDLLP